MHTASSSVGQAEAPPPPTSPTWSNKHNSLSADDVHVAKDFGERSWLTGGRTYPNLAEEAAARGRQAPQSIRDQVEFDAMNNDLSGKSRFRRAYFDNLVKKITPKDYRQRNMDPAERWAEDLGELARKDNLRVQAKKHKEFKKMKKEEKKEEKRIKQDQKKHKKYVKEQQKLDKQKAELNKKYGQDANNQANNPLDNRRISELTQSEFKQLMQQEAFYASIPKSGKNNWAKTTINSIASALAIGLITGPPLYLVHMWVECEKTSGGMGSEIMQACMFRSPETLEELKTQFLNETLNGTLPDLDRERDEFRNDMQESLVNVTRFIKNADAATKKRLDEQDDVMKRFNTAMTMLRNQIRYNDPGMHITRNGGVPEEYLKLAYKFDVDSICDIANVNEQWFWSHYELMTECSDFSEGLIAWIREDHPNWSLKMDIINQLIYRQAKVQARKYGHDDFTFRAFQTGITNCQLPVEPEDDYIADPNPEQLWDIPIPDDILKLSRYNRRKRSVIIDTKAPDTTDLDEQIMTLATYELERPDAKKRLNDGALSYVTNVEWEKFINYGQPQNGQHIYLPLMICITLVLIVIASLATRIYLAKSKTIDHKKDTHELEPLKPIIKVNAKITEQTPFSTAV